MSRITVFISLMTVLNDSNKRRFSVLELATLDAYIDPPGFLGRPRELCVMKLSNVGVFYAAPWVRSLK